MSNRIVMIKIPSLVKLNSPKSFQFRPRFYNEREIAKKERLARVEHEIAMEEHYKKNPEAKLRDEMQMNWQRKHVRESVNASNKTILIIALALGVMAYLFLYF